MTNAVNLSSPNPPVQDCGKDIGLTFGIIVIIVFVLILHMGSNEFQCQNSAGQLCVVPAESTLHTFCSKYVSVVKGNTLQVVLSQSFCTFLLVFFYYYSE